jgi:hypothetical protein
MPIHKGIQNGHPYYQWGESGKKYFYISGNKPTRDHAKERAIRQGKAIKIHRKYHTK